MARVITTMGALTDAQIKGLYALADQLKVSIVLWQDTPSPARDSFRWAVNGGVVGINRFLRQTKHLR